MEKIEIGKCLSEFPDGDAGKIIGTSGANGVLTTPIGIAETGQCLVRKRLYFASGDTGYYSKIASIYPISQEGVLNNFSLLINGGNNYALPKCIIAFSLVVQKKEIAYMKNNIIGSLEIGYVHKGDKLELWLKTPAYSSPTEVFLLSNSSNANLVSGFSSNSVPDGYTITV